MHFVNFAHLRENEKVSLEFLGSETSSMLLMQ